MSTPLNEAEIRTALARVGNAAFIGVSNDVPSTSHMPSARREATTASFGSVVTATGAYTMGFRCREVMVSSAGSGPNRAVE
jgi:hypothetical protein